jgi:hypothetical protein
VIVSHQFIATDAVALAALLQQWRQRWPGMGVFAMVPEQEQDAVALLQGVCRAQQLPLLGAIFPALICQASFRTTGLLLLCMAEMPAYFLLEGLQTNGAQRMAAALHTMLAQSWRAGAVQPTLVTIFDAMLPNIGSLLNGMNQGQERAPVYLGVNAGSESFQAMPCLFDGHRLVQDGVLGLLVGDMKRAAVHHAYAESKSLCRATSAQGNRIVTVDGKPAFAAYQEIIAAEYGVALTPENFYANAVHFPFGLVTAVDILVRIPVGLEDDGSLLCVGEVAPDSMLRVLKAPSLAESRCVTDICATLKAQLRWGHEDALLTFYCAGRRMHFGADAAQELVQIQSGMACTQMYGALSLGEIDTFASLNFPRFHNAAVVCIAQPHKRRAPAGALLDSA